MWQDGGFDTHVSKRSNRGSRLGTAVFVILVLALGGGGGYFVWDLEGLIAHVAEQDPLATAAARVLAWRGAPEDAWGPLRAALDEGDAGLRAAAATALGSAENEDLAVYLGDAALHDEDEDVRVAAVLALGRTGGGILRFLRAAFDDESLAVQAAACTAAGELEEFRLAPELIARVDHADLSVRRAALAALETFVEEGADWGHDRGAWMRWYQSR